jgi:hypothetical protein
MAQITNLPALSASLSLDSQSTPGAAIPSKALMVAGSDGTNLRTLSVSAAGVLNVAAASLPLPTGAATEATLSTLNGKIPSNLTVTSTRLLVDPSGVTSPISAASLPLPSGAATSAKQDSQTALLTSLDATATVIAGNLTTDAGLPPTYMALIGGLNSGLTAANALQVDNNGVAKVSVDGTVAATQSGTWTVQPGNTANTTAWLVDQVGRAKADTSSYNDYSSTSVTTAAYVELEASLAAACKEIEIFDSSGQGMILAVGAAASEVDQIYIFPGGNGRVPLAIAASSRVSIKAKTATASSGFIMINYYT